MEERENIEVKTLPWISEGVAKHTIKARRTSILVDDDFHECTQKALFISSRKWTNCIWAIHFV